MSVVCFQYLLANLPNIYAILQSPNKNKGIFRFFFKVCNNNLSPINSDLYFSIEKTLRNHFGHMLTEFVWMTRIQMLSDWAYLFNKTIYYCRLFFHKEIRRARGREREPQGEKRIYTHHTFSILKRSHYILKKRSVKLLETCLRLIFFSCSEARKIMFEWTNKYINESIWLSEHELSIL